MPNIQPATKEYLPKPKTRALSIEKPKDDASQNTQEKKNSKIEFNAKIQVFEPKKKEKAAKPNEPELPPNSRHPNPYPDFNDSGFSHYNSSYNDHSWYYYDHRKYPSANRHDSGIVYYDQAGNNQFPVDEFYHQVNFVYSSPESNHSNSVSNSYGKPNVRFDISPEASNPMNGLYGYTGSYSPMSPLRPWHHRDRDDKKKEPLLNINHQTASDKPGPVHEKSILSRSNKFPIAADASNSGGSTFSPYGFTDVEFQSKSLKSKTTATAAKYNISTGLLKTPSPSYKMKTPESKFIPSGQAGYDIFRDRSRNLMTRRSGRSQIRYGTGIRRSRSRIQNKKEDSDNSYSKSQQKYKLPPRMAKYRSSSEKRANSGTRAIKADSKEVMNKLESLLPGIDTSNLNSGNVKDLYNDFINRLKLLQNNTGSLELRNTPKLSDKLEVKGKIFEMKN